MTGGEPAAGVVVRPARADDAAAIGAIYNAGIRGREATFETDLRTADDFEPRARSERHPMIVAELNGAVVGWAGTAPYSDREAYAGVAECSIYVAPEERRRGIGARLAGELALEAERRGFHKLLGKLFVDNAASVRLVRRAGFREVGLHVNHGRLDGRWRDVLLVERLLGEAAAMGDRA